MVIYDKKREASPQYHLSRFLMRVYLSHQTKRTDVMMAAELYQKPLAGYEASLGKGESVSLSMYFKIHHVNNRGLRYWMKKHSIEQST
jgi:hypothetical protein